MLFRSHKYHDFYLNFGTNAGSFRGGAALSLTSNSNHDIYALNNTCYNIVCGAEMTDTSGNTRFEMQNNIFVLRDSPNATDPSEDAIDMAFIHDGGNNAAFGESNLFQILDGTETWYYNGSRYATLALFETAAGGNFANGSIADPLFEDSASGDFRLGSGSPALISPDLVAVDTTAPYTEFNTRYGLTLTAPTYIGAKPAS